MKSPISYLPLASGFLVLVLSLTVGVLTVTSKGSSNLASNTNQNLATKAAEENATMALSPATGDFVVDGKTSYPVGIIVNSSGKTIDGVDIILTFDPKKIQVNGTTVTVTNSFEQYPVNKIDNVKGEIRLSALAFTPKAITGIVGTFRVKPIARGQATINFQFAPGATTDSNIADHATAQDILGSVTNASFNFQ
ncbi:hypothetical protein M1403_03160 [Patescibacteria group bacterium]|nr:hypothetical protein [Patescibacteria group bacterium]